MKEETYPEHAYKPLFVLAPAMAFIPALITWAVIPFGAPWDSPWGRIDMALAPLPIGFLYVLAISSLGVYGIVIAGWASNNKYSFLGGLRSSAQMVSYEIAMGMSTIPVLLLAGNVALGDVIAQQAAVGWNVLTLTLAFFVFMIAAFAETNRLPFDLPEAESELIAGYHSEYSAMKFSFFFIAEYANMVTISALMATLFFGGWDIPLTAWDNAAPHTGLKTALTGITLVAKILFFIFLFMWIRWTLPRFRYDQLMALGWKILLPLSLGYIVLIAGAVLALDAARVPRGWMFGAALFGLNVVVMLLVALGLDRGRVISPATTRVGADELGRLRVRPARRPAAAGAGD
jgi:NADH-quinone oxidoreductase subunit H